MAGAVLVVGVLSLLTLLVCRCPLSLSPPLKPIRLCPALPADLSGIKLSRILILNSSAVLTSPLSLQILPLYSLRRRLSLKLQCAQWWSHNRMVTESRAAMASSKLEDEGKANRRGKMHVEEEAPGVTLPPGGSPLGASVSVVVEGSSCGTHPMSDPPGGSGAGDEAKGDDICYGNECPVVEEPLDQDVVM